MNRLTEFLTKEQKKTFLDIGTGPGNFIQFLQSIYPDFDSIVGIDTMERFIDIARKNFPDERIRFTVMDGYHMTFEDNSFDVVCLSNSLHHLSDMKAMLKEMARVCKPDGFLLLNEMIADQLDDMQESHKMMHHFAAKIDRERGDVHYETFTHQQIIDILQDVDGITLEQEWLLEVPRRTENTEQELNYILTTLDRVYDRTPDHLKESLLSEKEQIKSYIDAHGYDGCPSLCAIMTPQK